MNVKTKYKNLIFFNFYLELKNFIEQWYETET